MQLIDSQSALNPLCNPIYRYSGQPIYAVHEVVDESLEIIQQLHLQNHLVRAATGKPDVHCLTPFHGKSASALNITQNLSVKKSIPVAIFSLEQAKEQLVMRMLSIFGRANIGIRRFILAV